MPGSRVSSLFGKLPPGMGKLLVRTLPFVLLAVLVGVGSAYGVNLARKGSSATAINSPSPQASAAESPSPSPSESASPAASPSPLDSPSPAAVPSPSPVPAPSPAASPTSAGAAAAYPQEISAGNGYHYNGSGHRAVLAQDSRDSGSTICAGINESTQAFPAGYEGVFFVAIQFPDGNRLSAGYVRTGAGRFDFGQLDNDATGAHFGKQAAVTPGSHTYCITHSAAGWVMTDDGSTIYTSGSETAASTSGATLRFENLTGPDPRISPAPPPSAYVLVVPGFHDIKVAGAAPTQLVGTTFYLS